MPPPGFSEIVLSRAFHNKPGESYVIDCANVTASLVVGGDLEVRGRVVAAQTATRSDVVGNVAAPQLVSSNVVDARSIAQGGAVALALAGNAATFQGLVSAPAGVSASYVSAGSLVGASIFAAGSLVAQTCVLSSSVRAPTAYADLQGNVSGTTVVVTSLSATSAAISGDAVIAGNAWIRGNAIIAGQTTTINTAQLTVQDPVVVVGTGAPALNAPFVGVMTQTPTGNAAIAWNTSAGGYQAFLTPSAANAVPLVVSRFADMTVGNLVAVTATADLRGNVSGTTAILANTLVLNPSGATSNNVLCVYGNSSALGASSGVCGLGTTATGLRYNSQGTHAWYSNATQTMLLDSNGNLTATGDISAFSDVRLKANVAPIASPLHRLGGVRGCTFERVDMPPGAGRLAGVLAQEVAAALPEAVRSAEDGTLSVSLAGLVALCVESIKELRARVDALSAA